MSRDFAEWAGCFFLEKSDENTEYLILEEQDRMTGCRDSLVALEGVQENLRPRAESNLDNTTEGVVGNDVWDFDGALAESPHSGLA